MLTRNAALMISLLGLIACGDIPDVGGAQAEAARNAPYPDLVRLDTLLNAQQNTPTPITAASIATTNDRIAQLRARAARLRGPVIDPATRSQMRAASARAALR